MFSLPEQEGIRSPVVTYVEWAAFVLMLLLLAGLWFFIRFGIPGTKKIGPEQTMDNILASLTATEPAHASPEVLESLSSVNTDESPTSSQIPQSVLDTLSAK